MDTPFKTTVCESVELSTQIRCFSSLLRMNSSRTRTKKSKSIKTYKKIKRSNYYEKIMECLQLRRYVFIINFYNERNDL